MALFRPKCKMCHLPMLSHCTSGKCGWWECTADGIIHDGKFRWRSRWTDLGAV